MSRPDWMFKAIEATGAQPDEWRWNVGGWENWRIVEGRTPGWTASATLVECTHGSLDIQLDHHGDPAEAIDRIAAALPVLRGEPTPAMDALRARAERAEQAHAHAAAAAAARYEATLARIEGGDRPTHDLDCIRSWAYRALMVRPSFRMAGTARILTEEGDR